MTHQTGPILVVDDDEAVRHSLQFALELEGLDVRLYQGAADLLSDAELPRTGCLVVDYSMPAMDGFQLVGRLRERHIDLPAILITGRSSDDLYHRAEAAGFFRLVEKPFEDSSLLDSIQDALAVSARATLADLSPTA
jgi:FixJ family two-component response regulator